MRRKTEEAEILKTEIKDLKELMKMETLLSEEDENIPEKEVKCSSSDEENLLKMKKSGFKRKNPQTDPTKQSLPKGKDSKTEKKQFNCSECYFQGTKEIELNKHVNLKHRTPENIIDDTIKCRNCGEEFSSKWNLLTHRKTKHVHTVAICGNKLAGKVIFLTSCVGRAMIQA